MAGLGCADLHTLAQRLASAGAWGSPDHAAARDHYAEIAVDFARAALTAWPS